MLVSGRFALRVAAKGDTCFSVFCLSALLCVLIAVNSSADEIRVDESTDASLAETEPADAKAAAQAPSADESAVDQAASDEPSAHQVGDVIVTATRTDTPAAQVASSVTVVTSEEIERRQLRLVTDVLRRVPGVDVRRTGGNDLQGDLPVGDQREGGPNLNRAAIVEVDLRDSAGLLHRDHAVEHGPHRRRGGAAGGANNRTARRVRGAGCR